jgi:hypothetical protein
VTEHRHEGVLAVSAVLAVLFERGTIFSRAQSVLKRTLKTSKTNETGGFEGSF